MCLETAHDSNDTRWHVYNAHVLYCSALSAVSLHLVAARLLEEPFATLLRRGTVGLEDTSLSLSCDSITAMSLSERQKRASFTTTPRKNNKNKTCPTRIPSRTWSKSRYTPYLYYARRGNAVDGSR